jgi:peptidoglycan/LPS O-acetylase OafA/YrhL
MTNQTRIEILVLLLIAIVSATIVSPLATQSVTYRLYAYIVSFIISPIAVGLLTIYLIVSHKFPKNRVISYLIFVLGLLLIGLSMTLVMEISALSLVILVIGGAIMAAGANATWSDKVSVESVNASSSRQIAGAMAPETPKSFLKSCVACGRQIPVASEECPFCQAKQP